MMVRTEGLAKTYGVRPSLSDVGIDVAAGSVYGLVGPNGAGKTTLLSILAGLRYATAGEVHVAAPRQRVAVLPDTPKFEPWLSGREVVGLAARLAGVSDEAAAVDRALADAGLTDRADHHTGGYSRGMLRRLGLAATLVGDPELLLLDVPASALDPAGRREVLDLIARLRGQATVVLSSHLLADVQEVCDTIGILRSSRLLYQGRIEDLLIGQAVPAYRLVLRPPVDSVADVLSAAPWVREVQVRSDAELRVLVTSLALGTRAPRARRPATSPRTAESRRRCVPPVQRRPGADRRHACPQARFGPLHALHGNLLWVHCARTALAPSGAKVTPWG